MIYLDYNATTPILPEVADAVREVSLRHGANPGSAHGPGRLARKALEDSRERIGELLGAQTGGGADRVILTSGGTEANHLALFGLLSRLSQPGASHDGRLVISAIEHPSIAEPAAVLEQQGWQVDRVAVDQHGVVRLDQFEKLLRPETRLVALMLANNETGVVQPVAEVAKLCVEREILLHTDAAQAVGKLPVDFAALGVSSLACAAHKFHGPLGIGVLVVQHGVPLAPTMYGGHQQSGLRPGTEPVALAVGMQTALESWEADADASSARITALRDRLQRLLVAETPSSVVVGEKAQRLPGTLNIGFPDVDRQALVMALDLEAVACSTGSACASGSSEPSPVHLAMGLEKAVCGGAIRLSLGSLTSESDVDEAARRILNVCGRLRRASNR